MAIIVLYIKLAERGEITQMQDLIASLEKLHTTDSGAKRIRHNLDLQNTDVVLWCREFIKQADITIRQEKNWYVYSGGVVVGIKEIISRLIGKKSSINLLIFDFAI